ncbi:MAG TPA: flagellar hook protein FlgE [Burkholderiales bacterium]|nr:flagellar hook protein FlgE [Burkholderiales bacterium]
MSFEQGLSGLNAASAGLDVAGNNIANASTVGFKSARPEFADVFANSLIGSSTNAVGIGTQLAAVTTQLTQGNVSVTNNPFDLAINGGGFFRMSENGLISYTRNGQFGLDKNGFMVDNGGRRLTGFAADALGNIVPSAPVDIQLSTSDIAASATTQSALIANFDSRSSPPVTAIFDPLDATSFNSSTAFTVFDTLGNPHVLSLYFVKTAAPGQWTLHATVDGTAETRTTLSSNNIQFDAFGALTAPAVPINVSVDLNQIAVDLGTVNSANSPLPFTLDFSGTTQFGSPFGVTTITQDGFSSGRLSGVSIGADGIIQGRYSNGQARNLAQVVLATFVNGQGLKPLGHNQYAETPDSGAALVGAPSTGSLGALQSAAVEESNVDLTAELINLITLQRVYQANAQTIKTQDAVLQTLVNLR